MSEPLLLTVDQAAELCQISGDALRTRISAGEIQTVNVGSARRPRIRIERAALEEFIASRRSNRPTRTAS